MFSLMPWRKGRECSGRLVTQTERPMSLFRPELDQWFDRMFAGLAPLFGDGSMSEYGLVIEEKDEAVLIRADAPGFEPADFDIQVSEDSLTIMAERKKEGEGKTPIIERRLERKLMLPAKVDPDSVEARYHNGVLELRLIRTQPSKHRKIEVKGV